MFTVGILSDTHIQRPDNRIRALFHHCFSGCEAIIHAGDLTKASVLECFAPLAVYAVHGNMCDMQVQRQLPATRTIRLGDHTIGLTHGAGLGSDIEGRLWDLFPEVDCVIYGHTHQPVCHRQNGRLINNPGTFLGSGLHGCLGTYALLKVGKTLEATLQKVDPLP